MALQAVQKPDALFEIECAINGHGPAERLAVRRGDSVEYAGS